MPEEERQDVLFSRDPLHKSGRLLDQDNLFYRTYIIPSETRGERFQRKWQDRMNRILALEKSVVTQGGTITDESSAYDAERLHYGIAEHRGEILKEKYILPLAQVLARNKRQGLSYDDLVNYLYAKHTPDRAAYVARIRGGQPDAEEYGSGMSLEEAQSILDDFEERGKTKYLDEAAQIVWAINADTRRIISGNLEPKEKVQAWINNFGAYYVPLHTAETESVGGVSFTSAGTGQGLSVRGSGIRNVTGRRTRAGNIIENTIAQNMNTIIRDENNNVMKNFWQFVLDNPDNNLWTVDDLPKKPIVK